MTTFRRSLTILLLGGIGLLAGAGGTDAQGILDTKHNLSALAGTAANRSVGNQELYLTAGTQEVCVFCHTPHGANTAVSAPLWNRAVTTSTYTMYSSPTMDSTPSSVAADMGVSLACLSCHDGTVAFDALRNLPGPGGYDPAVPVTGANPAGWVWNAGNKVMPAGSITNLGTDLSNDHPIAMIYNDARSPSSLSQDETSGFTAAAATGSRVYVERTLANPNVTVKLPLYGTTTANARVQCASCHDPHSKVNATFLRADNSSGSALCRTCHKKDG